MVLLLLALLFSTCQGAVQSNFIIDQLNLLVDSGANVKRNEEVRFLCSATISRYEGFSPPRLFIFYHDEEMVYNVSSQKDQEVYTVPQARVAHTGTYTCHIKIEQKEERSKNVMLSVTGLITPYLSLDKQYISEGEEVRARCQAPGEIGPFIFTFFDGSEELRRSNTKSDTTEVQLKPNHGAMQLSCRYMVRLASSFVTSNRSNSVTLRVKELHFHPVISVWPQRATEGDQLNITCNVHEPIQTISTYLSKDGNILKTSTRSFSMIVEARESGLYTCISEMNGVPKKAIANVSIAELFSNPVLTMDPPEVFENEPFVLKCISDKIATNKITQNDVKYYIYRNDKLLTMGSFNGIFSALASTFPSGNFYCTAKAKSISKNSTELIFKAKELVSVPWINVTSTVILGRTFQIECGCEKGHLPINYTLLEAGRPVQTVEVRRPFDRALFHVSITKEDDIGKFFCKAYNNGPSSSKRSPALYSEVIEPLSQQLYLITVPYIWEIEEEMELNLICSAPKGSFPITYEWYRTDQKQPVFRHLEVYSNSSSYRVMTVIQDLDGKYYCTATNMAGQSRSNNVVIGVKMATWKKGLIGCLVFMFLIAIICIPIFIMYYKSKKGKREVTAELSVKPSSPNSDDTVRMSLIHDTEAYTAHTVSVGIAEESVWCERPVDADIPDYGGHDSPNESDVEYTEVVHPHAADPSRGADDLHGDSGSVEYAQLNHSHPEPVHDSGCV